MRPITTIDCHYLQPGYAAAYLLVNGGRATFVEANTTHAVPRLLEALAHAGLSVDAVDHVVITHVHLDHAGGASALMNACPNATLLAHPRAAPHVIDPSKLVASARKVYGDARFEALYGRIDPVAAARVRIMNDDEVLDWHGRPLRFLHTRGHANHHFVVVDEKERAVFTGDAFGLRYPALQAKGLFIFPSTSPTDFDGAEAHRAVDRIVATGCTRAFPTHFGEVTALAEAAAQLHAHLDVAERLRDEAAASTEADGALDAWVETRLAAHFEKAFAARGLPMDDAARALIATDLDLNAQGIAHAARKKRAGK